MRPGAPWAFRLWADFQPLRTMCGAVAVSTTVRVRVRVKIRRGFACRREIRLTLTRVTLRLSLDGEDDGERGAFSGFALDVDGAGVRVNDGVHDAEAEAGSAAAA